MRILYFTALVSFATGCLSQSLSEDRQAVLAVWTFDAETDLGCTLGRVDLPLMRIRAHVQGYDDDDELFDWVPCVTDVPSIDVPPQHGLTTPLELGSYDIELEMWTADRSRRIARSRQPATAVLTVNPNDVVVMPYRVDIVLETEQTFVYVPHDVEPQAVAQ